MKNATQDVIPAERDRPVVTPEMAEAGAEVLLRSGYLFEPAGSGVRILAQQVFEAMIGQRSQKFESCKQ